MSYNSKRLAKTREEFNELSKRDVKRWQRIKEMKDNQRLEELQQKEIQEINKRIMDLRDEYKRITSSRGSAHKWAEIVAKHESEVQEFDKRRNASVDMRSKRVLKDFINENNIKQNNIEIEKRNRLLRRKQLMKSSLYPKTLETELIPDEEEIQLMRKLENLQKSENYLKELIEKKRQISHSEESIERNAEKLFWPKKLVSKHDLLFPSVSSLSGYTKPKTIEIEDKTKQKKEFLKYESNERDFSENDIHFDDSFPISIAKKLYEKLNSHRMAKNKQKSTKLYRNVCISTTPPITPSKLSPPYDDSSDQSFGPSSCQTSYLSVPKTPEMRKNKAKTVLTNLFKNKKVTENKLELESTLLQDLTLSDDSNSSLDPLIDRINNLKELIDRKVGRNENTGHLEDVISGGDSKRLVSKSFNRLDSVEGSVNGVQSFDPKNELSDEISNNNLDAISLSSSASFKTLLEINSSGRSSPSGESSLQILDQNNEFSSKISSVHSLDSVLSNKSIGSSILSSQPLRDRNAFWKEVFDRAGIDIDSNQIDSYLPNYRTDSEPTIESLGSFTLNSFSTKLNSHSTPKR